MVNVTCMYRQKNSQGRIVKYSFVDMRGNVIELTPEKTKYLMESRQIKVSNLKLTKDNRIVCVSSNGATGNTKHLSGNNKINRRRLKRVEPDKVFDGKICRCTGYEVFLYGSWRKEYTDASGKAYYDK